MKIQLEDKWMMVLQSLVGALNTSTKHGSATATATCHINNSVKKKDFWKNNFYLQCIITTGM